MREARGDYCEEVGSRICSAGCSAKQAVAHVTNRVKGLSWEACIIKEHLVDKGSTGWSRCKDLRDVVPVKTTNRHKARRTRGKGFFYDKYWNDHQGTLLRMQKRKAASKEQSILLLLPQVAEKPRSQEQYFRFKEQKETLKGFEAEDAQSAVKEVLMTDIGCNHGEAGLCHAQPTGFKLQWLSGACGTERRPALHVIGKTFVSVTAVCWWNHRERGTTLLNFTDRGRTRQEHWRYLSNTRRCLAHNRMCSVHEAQSSHLFNCSSVIRTKFCGDQERKSVQRKQRKTDIVVGHLT